MQLDKVQGNKNVHLGSQFPDPVKTATVGKYLRELSSQ